MIAVPYTDQDIDVTTRTVWGEARNQLQLGQIAVAWTVRTRSIWDEMLASGHPEHEWWGVSPASVVEHPWQYSSWNRNDPNFPKLVGLSTSDPLYQAIKALVLGVFNGLIPDPTGGCTTYKVTGTTASWDHAVVGVPPRIIGAHSFWRLGPNGLVLPYLDAAPAYPTV